MDLGGFSGELVHVFVECQLSTLGPRQSVIRAAGSPDVRYPPCCDLVSFPMSMQDRYIDLSIFPMSRTITGYDLPQALK